MPTLDQRIRARLASYDTDAADLLEYAAVADALRAVLDELHTAEPYEQPDPDKVRAAIARELGITEEVTQ